MATSGTEIEVVLLKRKLDEALKILSKLCTTLVLDDDITRRKKLWQLKEEIDKALSK